MPVKRDASGRRSVQAEVEVPGSPEDVWQTWLSERFPMAAAASEVA